MMAVSIAVHPLLSVIVPMYVPAISPIIVSVVAPLLQAYVYGNVPPAPVITAEPSLPPLHVTLLRFNEDLSITIPYGLTWKLARSFQKSLAPVK